MAGNAPRRPAARTSSRLLENYEIHRLLGSGSFGAVFDCMNKFEKKNYAIKIMKFDTVFTEREIANLIKIPNHSNIVQYFTCWKDSMGIEDVAAVRKRFAEDEDFGCDNFVIPPGQITFDAICILMELCGEDLRTWLSSRETVQESTCINIFTQISNGVEHLHKNGLIHRDLKPENILFSKQDKLTVKIGDLGIATNINRSRYTTGLGTRTYLAPEQEGNSYGPQVDIFALGIIFLELLHPQMQPNSDDEEGKAGNLTKVAIELKYLHKVPEEVSRLWPVAADLILKMVSIDPAHRPSFDEIYETIEKICSFVPPESVQFDVRESPEVEVHKKDDKKIQLNITSWIERFSLSLPSTPIDDSEWDDEQDVRPLEEHDDKVDAMQITLPLLPKINNISTPTVRTAISSHHLESLLQSSSPHDTILLLESTRYFGNFEISSENLTISGNGATICGLPVGLKLQANQCIVKNLNLQSGTGMVICGQDITVEDVTVCLPMNESHVPKNDTCGIIIQGNCNSIKNCSIQGHNKGILGTGDNNTFDAIKISNCSQKAVISKGSNCTLNNFECSDCPNGLLWIGGNNNIISGISYKISQQFAKRYKFGEISTCTVITIGNGEDNSISNFNNFANLGEYKYGLYASIYTSRLEIVDSSLGKLYLDGNEHNIKNTAALGGVSIIGNKCTLTTVNCGPRLDIIQGRSHVLTKCSADQFTTYDCCDVEITECNFD